MPEADIAIIDHAAEDTIMEARPIRMVPTGIKAFASALAAAPVAVPQVVKTLKQKAPWEGGAKG